MRGVAIKPWVWLSAAVFAVTAVLAAIDDDPPRLVVWAGTIQFVVTLLFGIDYKSLARGNAGADAVDDARREEDS